MCVADKVIQTLGEGTFGKVVECADLSRYTCLCLYLCSTYLCSVDMDSSHAIATVVTETVLKYDHWLATWTLFIPLVCVFCCNAEFLMLSIDHLCCSVDVLQLPWPLLTLHLYVNMAACCRYWEVVRLLSPGCIPSSGSALSHMPANLHGTHWQRTYLLSLTLDFSENDSRLTFLVWLSRLLTVGIIVYALNDL